MQPRKASEAALGAMRTQRPREENTDKCTLGGLSDLQATAVKAIKSIVVKTAKYLEPDT